MSRFVVVDVHRAIPLVGNNAGGACAMVSVGDYDAVTSFSRRWHNSGGYARCCVRHTIHRSMHQIVMNAKTGQQVDHINGNKLDNRRENLRFCDHRQNQMNRKPDKGKRFKGTTFHRSIGKWVAQIGSKKKRFYLGCFDTEEAAARAYNKAALEKFGEYAFINHV